MAEPTVDHPIIRVVCRSLSPMLQDFNFSMISSEQLTARWRSWYESLERRHRASFTLYHGSNNKLGIPFEMLNAALKAAQALQEKQGIAPVILGMPFCDFIPFDEDSLQPDWDHPTEHKNNIREGWVPDVRATRQGRSTRAKFPTWGFTTRCYVAETDEVTLMEVRLLFNYAGLKCGLGAYRPAQGGPFGSFSVIGIAVEPTK